MIMKKMAVAGAALVLVLALTAAEEVTAVVGARVLTGTGVEIENGTVLIEGGRIKAVGKAGEVPVPAGARVVDAAGRVVTPGLIDSHSHLGLGPSGGVTEDNETSNPVTPELRIVDSIHPEGEGPDEFQFRRALAEGVTTVVARPGSGNVIGGQSAVLKLRGGTVDDMVILFPADMKMALGRKGAYAAKGVMPTTKMGAAYLVRKALVEAAEYGQALERYDKEKAKNPKAAPPARDLGKEALLKVVRREIPVHIHVDSSDDIMTAVRLAEEFKFLRLSLGHAVEAYKVAGELARRGVIGRRRSPDDGLRRRGAPRQSGRLPGRQGRSGRHHDRRRRRPAVVPPLSGGDRRQVRHGPEGGAQVDHPQSGPDHGPRGPDRQPRAGQGRRPGRLRRRSVRRRHPDAHGVHRRPDRLRSRPGPEVKGGAKMKRAEAIILAMALAAGTVSLAPAAGAAEKTVVVRGGRVVPVSGPEIENGAVLIEGGKIKAVGKADEIAVPAGAEIVDAAGGWILPGFVECLASIGLGDRYGAAEGDEVSDPVTAGLRILDGYQSLRQAFRAGGAGRDRRRS